MEREEKYLVIKLADLQNYLPDMEHNEIIRLAQLVKQRRIAAGKQDTQYVCVADDWPMYEMVWSLIERWVDSGAPPSMPCYSAELSEAINKIAANTHFSQDALLDHLTDWLCANGHQGSKFRSQIERYKLSRDANRYRFLRDEDNWGEDSGNDCWERLGESHASAFDEIVDSRMQGE